MHLLTCVVALLALVCVVDMAGTTTAAAQISYCGDTAGLAAGGCKQCIGNIENRAAYARKDATMVTIWVSTNFSYSVNTTAPPPPLVVNVTVPYCKPYTMFNGTDNVTYDNCTMRNETHYIPQYKTVNETLFKAVYIPTVDVFQMLEIIDSGLYMYRDTTARVKVSVYQQGVTQDPDYPNQIFSPEKIYTDATMFVETWGIIAAMSKGVYQSLTWDDGCDNCVGGSQDCVDATCATHYSDFINDTTIDFATRVKRTNVKIQFSWVGDDVKSQTMTSKGYLFSNFQRYSIASGVQTGIGVSSQIADTVNEDGSAFGQGQVQ